MSRVRTHFVLALLVAIGQADVSLAATANWTNSDSTAVYTVAGNWTDSVNSVIHAVPGAADTAVFNRNATYEVRLPGRPITTPLTREVRQLKVTSGTLSLRDFPAFNELPASFSINSSGALVDQALLVGESTGQTAVLNLNLGDISTRTLTLGKSAGATGTLNVTGGILSTFATTADPDFVVGDLGNGVLSVTSGAQVVIQSGTAAIAKNTGSTGQVTVSGAGSRFEFVPLTVGSGGALSISASGVADGYIDRILGSITVDGTGSVWEGNFGVAATQVVGTLSVLNGARMGTEPNASNEIGIDIHEHGQLIASGNGTIVNTRSINNGAPLRVSGRMTVSNGGRVNTFGDGEIRASSGVPVGSVTVNGPGSVWAVTRQIDASGILRIQGGGRVTSETGFCRNCVMDGPTTRWTSDGDIVVAGLDLSNGAIVESVSGKLVVQNNGVLSGNGNISANTLNNGFISPGQSIGVLNFHGNFTQQAGAIQIELGGLAAGVHFDRVAVSGTLRILGGNLNVSLANSFMPAAGNTFDILDSLLTDGTFAAVNLPTLPAGFAWNTSQLYTTGVISVAAVGIPGDYNANGIVDTADYVVWRNNAGTTNVLPNDSIGGTIGPAQYNAWRAHFGQTAGSGAGAAFDAVPEPTATLLASVALALCAHGRKRFW